MNTVQIAKIEGGVVINNCGEILVGDEILGWGAITHPIDINAATLAAPIGTQTFETNEGERITLPVDFEQDPAHDKAPDPLDRLAGIVTSVLPDTVKAMERIMTFRDQCPMTDSALAIVAGMIEQGRADPTEFHRKHSVDPGDPETLRVWLAADKEPGARWGLDHLIVNTINWRLVERDVPAGEWLRSQWLELAAHVERYWWQVENASTGTVFGPRFAFTEQQAINANLRDATSDEASYDTVAKRYEQGARVVCAHESAGWEGTIESIDMERAWVRWDGDIVAVDAIEDLMIV